VREKSDHGVFQVPLPMMATQFSRHATTDNDHTQLSRPYLADMLHCGEPWQSIVTAGMQSMKNSQAF